MADLTWLVREHLGEDAELLERDSGTLSRGRAAAGLLRGGLDARRGGGGRPAHGRPRGARPQRAPGPRPARAGRGRARGGRARRRAPAQLPAGVRGGHVLHARRGLHALPRAQHVARACASTAAARAPRRSSTARRWRCTSAGWPACVDAFVVPSAFALAPAAGAGRSARRPRDGDRVAPARVRRASARATRARTRWWPPACRPRRASTWRSRPAGAPRCRSWWPATARRPRELRALAAGADVRFEGRVGPRAAGRAAPRGGRRRSSRRCTRRSFPCRGRGGDGRRPAHGGLARRRAGRLRARLRAVRRRRRGRARRAAGAPASATRAPASARSPRPARPRPRPRRVAGACARSTATRSVAAVRARVA